MRNLIRLGLIAATMVSFHSSAFSQGPPPGSYRETCSNVQMRGGTLFANCQDTEGRWRSTVLPEAYECVGDVTNINGELRCNRRDDWRDRDSLPRGSYRETCRQIRVSGDYLSAKCQTMSGRWNRTSLNDLDRCVGEIVNDDGNLRCGRRAWQVRGTFVETCAPIYLLGDVLRARCQTRDGGWVWTGLNDADGCRAGIVNVDGQLRCGGGDRDDYDRGRDRDHDGDRDGDRDRERGGDRDRDRGIPRGGYAQTCRNIERRGDTLRAECERRDGRWVWSDLGDIDRCRSEINNDDGRLVCAR
jgi:CVNH domain